MPPPMMARVILIQDQGLNKLGKITARYRSIAAVQSR